MAKTGTTGKGSRTISKREQRAIDSGKNLQRRIINTALRGITDIKVLIHRSEFSGLHKWSILNRKLGKGKRDDEPKGDSGYKRYPRRKDVQHRTGKVKLLFKPEDYGYGPSSLIATSDSTYDHLYNIYKRIPDFKTTRLEYAIDLYCRDPQAVSDLFYLLRRYLYVPNAKKTSMAGGKFYGWKDMREKNAVYYIWMGKYSGKHIKVYERGKDYPKVCKRTGWSYDKVDRVRIEFKLQRIAIAKKYGLSTLKDLLTNPKFADIASDYVQFKNFKFSTALPQDWEDYLSEDKRGNQESFVQEVLSVKDRDIKNVIQYIEDNQMMKALKKRIIAVSASFDRNWSKLSRRNGLQKP